jgi:hypothetical protein
VQTLKMTSPQRKYRVTKRFAIDFELVVWGRDENEAVQASDSAEISSWNEFDESRQLLEISQICYLALVEESIEPDIPTPVIKVWQRTQALGN